MRNTIKYAVKSLPYLNRVFGERDRLQAEVRLLAAEAASLRAETDRLRRAVRQHAFAPWYRLLEDCQEEIAAFPGTHEHYRNAYRDCESLYWMHIPKWLHLDQSAGPARRCLDVGCAYGTLLLFCKKLLGCEAYGTDFSDVSISREFIAEHGIQYRVNNIEREPFPWEGGFDRILFTEVLEHLNFHPVPTLRKFRDLLAPAGRLYLSTPDASQWGRVTKYYPSLEALPQPESGGPLIDDHVWQFSEDELLAVVREAGLRVERFDYSPGTLYRHFNLTLMRG
jgi:SAM-dependent methyltransferase